MGRLGECLLVVSPSRYCTSTYSIGWNPLRGPFAGLHMIQKKILVSLGDMRPAWERPPPLLVLITPAKHVEIVNRSRTSQRRTCSST